jgi:hypothetical protein
MINTRRRTLKLKIDRFVTEAITGAMGEPNADFRRVAQDFLRDRFRAFGRSAG